ncbi:MAG: orotidine-5'-phosphate decarboxylase [Polyangiaceae bacterium]
MQAGPEAVGLGVELGRDVFLDLKLCDIPETVGRAVGSAGRLGRATSPCTPAAGRRCSSAVAAAKDAPAPMTLLAVTLLYIARRHRPRGAGHRWQRGRGARRPRPRGAHGAARLAGRRARVRDLPAEAAALRDALGPDAFLVTPGGVPPARTPAIRSAWATPASAIGAGADLLVVGRPIRDAADPLAAARGLVDEIAGALPGAQAGAARAPGAR